MRLAGDEPEPGDALGRLAPSALIARAQAEGLAGDPHRAVRLVRESEHGPLLPFPQVRAILTAVIVAELTGELSRGAIRNAHQFLLTANARAALDRRAEGRPPRLPEEPRAESAERTLALAAILAVRHGMKDGAT